MCRHSSLPPARPSCCQGTALRCRAAETTAAQCQGLGAAAGTQGGAWGEGADPPSPTTEPAMLRSPPFRLSHALQAPKDCVFGCWQAPTKPPGPHLHGECALLHAHAHSCGGHGCWVAVCESTVYKGRLRGNAGSSSLQHPLKIASSASRDKDPCSPYQRCTQAL